MKLYILIYYIYLYLYSSITKLHRNLNDKIGNYYAKKDILSMQRSEQLDTAAKFYCSTPFYMNIDFNSDTDNTLMSLLTAAKSRARLAA